MTAEYVFGLERISQTRGTETKVFVADGQGSIRQLLDNAGLVTDEYDYFAFGEELSSTGSTENEFKYVGEAFDANSGNYYLRERWMNPGNGRFVSVDPFGGNNNSPLTLHRYLYGNASPVSFYDPSGEFTLGEFTAVTVTATTLAGIAIA